MRTWQSQGGCNSLTLTGPQMGGGQREIEEQVNLHLACKSPTRHSRYGALAPGAWPKLAFRC